MSDKVSMKPNNSNNGLNNNNGDTIFLGPVGEIPSTVLTMHGL